MAEVDMAEFDDDEGARSREQRATQARRRADEVQTRISQLRERAAGASHTTPAQHREELERAAAYAREAHDHLLSALEASAVAHERTSARYSAHADGDPTLEAKARDHLEWAAADRARAGQLRDAQPE